MSSPNYNFGIADDGMQRIWAPLASDGLKIEYYGKSLPGSATSAPLWQIQKWTYDANGFLTNIKHPNGSADCSFVWDSRANYTFL